jgi:hypothetical protein
LRKGGRRERGEAGRRERERMGIQSKEVRDGRIGEEEWDWT